MRGTSSWGKLALEKCFWTLVDWSWNEGNATIISFNSKAEVDGRLKLVKSEDRSGVVIKE